MKAIEVKDLVFSFNQKPLFSDFSLEVEAGEFLGIIGPNGSGKTTLLKIIANLLSLKKGEVFIFGESLNKVYRKELAKTIAFIPQEHFFAYDFSVFDVVLWGRYPYLKRFLLPQKEDIEKAIKAMEFTNTLQFKDKSINEISAGERQRVVLAQTLAKDPKILLLDEALVHLDITQQYAILKILKELNQKGITVVFISHDLNLAGMVCSRILLLDQGSIVIYDRPDRVLRPEILQSVYKIRPEIISHPNTGQTQIILPQP